MKNEIFEGASSNIDFLLKIIKYNISDKRDIIIRKNRGIYEIYSIKRENE